MTSLEMESTHLWASRKIFLERPPAFTTEMHTRQERDALDLLHCKQLVYRLYAALLVEFILPEERHKRHFCHAILKANESNSEMHDRAKTLIKNVGFDRVCRQLPDCRDLIRAA